jgi:hypothetical protein
MSDDCGTHSAAQRHRRKGEPLDPACLEANRAYMANYRATNDGARERSRRENSARTRALYRLKAGHQDEYVRYYAEELAMARRAK